MQSRRRGAKPTGRSPRARCSALHAAHALTSLLLIATGLLLGYPDLRSALVGGYGRQILDGHLWIGWAYLGAPVVAGAVAGRPLLRDLARRLGPPDPPFVWRKLHIVASLAMTILLLARVRSRPTDLEWVVAQAPDLEQRGYQTSTQRRCAVSAAARC